VIKIFHKIKFLLQRPPVIFVTGRGKEVSAAAIRQVLSRHFKVGKEVLVYPTDLRASADFNFMVKNSKLSILVATHAGKYHSEREFFAGAKADTADVEKSAEALSGNSYLVLNFDDETVRDIKNKSRAHVLTFGFGARADIQASDVVLMQVPTPGTNFKINYQGNIVPVWLPNLFGKEHIYAALAAVAVGEVLGLNLVEVSEALKKSASVLQ